MEGKSFEKQVVTHKMTKQRTKKKLAVPTLCDWKTLRNFYKQRNASRETKLKELQYSEKQKIKHCKYKCFIYKIIWI